MKRLCLVVLTALALTGCGGRKDKVFTIAFIPKIKGIPYFTACQRGAEEAGKELGVRVVYDGPTKAESNLQIDLLDNWIHSGDYDCFAVACTEKDRVSPTLRAARQQGLPVITYDADSQLTDVAREVDGSSSIQEHYEYDDNKNRLVREVTGSEREVSTYGDFDVLQQVGSTAYEFNADGSLTRRGSDTFHYAPGGELLEATAGGDSIHYTYDGLGRLTARATPRAGRQRRDQRGHGPGRMGVRP